MPDWLSVNPVNTPTAYSGMRAVVWPPKATISTAAMTARTTMPLEKTSRSPRFLNWWGRNSSRAMIDDNRGKSAYAVLAARIRMAKVENCST